jgi:AdoMet-dependent rRNA methyltransferase SPB1
VQYEQSSDDESDNEQAPKSLIAKLDGQDVKDENGLSKRAALFFDQSIFADIYEEDGEGKALDSSDNEGTFRGFDDEGGQSETKDVSAGAEEEDDKIEFVKDESRDAGDEPIKNRRPDIDIITAEAMSLAQQLVTGEKTKHDVIDDGFNKWSFRDRDGLPDWFLDTEDKYAKPIKPVTAAGAAAIKEKLRALNARPIKKVMEAKGRKKMKAAARIEKLKKKSALLAEDEGMTEKDKAQTIAKMMARAAKKKPKQQVKVVVARGLNKGQGRPRGVKGRYKIVDARLKKDVRAQKRVAKKMKKKR